MTPEENVPDPGRRSGTTPGLDAPASGAADAPTTARGREAKRRGGANMLPGRDRRRFGLERLLVRLVATTGIVGVGVALGAILVSQKVQGWIVGLVVAVVTVVLSAILWSSRQL
jgi:hypothetical protein